MTFHLPTARTSKAFESLLKTVNVLLCVAAFMPLFAAEAVEKRPFATMQWYDPCLVRVHAEEAERLADASRNNPQPVPAQSIETIQKPAQRNPDFAVTRNDLKRGAAPDHTDTAPIPIYPQLSPEEVQGWRQVADSSADSDAQEKFKEFRRIHLGAHADESPIKPAPQVISDRLSARIPSDRFTVGPVTIDAPEINYVPGLEVDKMKATQKIRPHDGQVSAQVSASDGFDHTPSSLKGGYEVGENGMMEYNLPVIVRKVEESLTRAHGQLPRKLGDPIGNGSYKWAFDSPHRSDRVILVFKPGGGNTAPIKKADVISRTAKIMKDDVDVYLVNREGLKKHRAEMQAAGVAVTDIRQLERTYTPEGTRMGYFEVERMPPINTDRQRLQPGEAIDLRQILAEKPELERHPDFMNLFHYIRTWQPLRLKLRMDRGLLSETAVTVPFKTRAEAENSIYCRLLGAKVSSRTSENAVKTWEVVLGVDNSGGKNFLAIPLPNGRYRFVIGDS